MMIKFDGQNSDRNTFTLERFEWITFGGWNNQNVPNEGKIETGYRYWSDPKSWATTTGATGVIPKAGDDVIIQSTWNMVLDLTDPPVFRSIEINGRLTIQNDGKTYNLQSYLIYVRKGELIVGTSDKPITGKVIFTLHGSRADKDVYFNDKMFEAGNKVIANTGLLNMYGKHITTKWTRLAQTAPSGQNWILLVDSPTDWTVGDELGINPSGRDYTQRDFAVIQSISGNNVTLSSPLVYTHYGASSIDSTKTGGIDIRAEVLHLTRNIVVKGTNVDRWGGHVVTAHNNDSGFVDGKLVTIQRKGYAIIDHVEFVNCSQYDTDKASVRFANFFALTDSDIQSSVSNSAIHNGLGIGIMVTSADNVLVNGNVVFFHHIGGVWLKKSNKVTITNNVAGGMGTRYWSEETKLDELAVFNIWNNDQICKNLVIKNNIVGGSERIGYLLPTTSWTESSPSYENNLAHSVQHGAWILKNNLITGWQAFRNFKAYKTMEQGVLTYQGYNELEVSNIETLDCGRGVTLNIGGLFDINNIRFKDSTIWGQTNLLPEDKGQFWVESYGFWIPQATLKGKVVPESMLSHLPYEKVISYANWFAEVRVSNIKFKNWDSAFRSCSASTLHRVFGINSDASDGVPVTYLDQIEFINVHNDAVVYLFTPPQKWAIVRDCGQFPCTGPLNTALKFTNTIASGSPVPNIYSITSSQIAFQIIPNNIGASENIDTWSLVSTWNSYLCKNDKIAQLMFESKDSDAETRTFSPINILDQNSKFNSTLNNFMDHCWDGHYTCQFRLSRFPSLIQTNRYYEIKFTGTQPANTRYTIAGGQTGVDWLHLKIDFSQSRLFNLYANGVLVKANDFDPKTNQLTPIQKLKWGENVYYKPTFIYEFYLTYGCTVKFEGVDYVEAMVRLQISYNDFFSSIGSTKFIDKFASVLGITQDTIRIVSVYEGSTVVYFAVTSPTSSGSSATTSALTSINDKLNYQCSNGNLDLGAPLLACSSQLVSSTGTVTSTGSGNYKKKEISNVVYVILAFAVFATAAAILIGSIKAIKITRSYKEITNLEISYEKGNAKSEFADQIDIKKENP